MQDSGWAYGLRDTTDGRPDPWLVIPGVKYRRPRLYPDAGKAMHALALSHFTAAKQHVVIAHVTPERNPDFDGGYAFRINEPGMLVRRHDAPAGSDVCYIQSIQPGGLFVLVPRNNQSTAIAGVTADGFLPTGDQVSLCAACRHELPSPPSATAARCAAQGCSCTTHSAPLAPDPPIRTPVRYVKDKHNHPALPFGAFVDPGECPRCDQRREERALEGTTDHNHQLLSFGQRKPRGECPRCDELHDGAAPRLSRTGQARRDDDQRAREIRGHDCAISSCGYNPATGAGVCTFGDW